MISEGFEPSAFPAHFLEFKCKGNVITTRIEVREKGVNVEVESTRLHYETNEKEFRLLNSFELTSSVRTESDIILMVNMQLCYTLPGPQPISLSASSLVMASLEQYLQLDKLGHGGDLTRDPKTSHSCLITF